MYANSAEMEYKFGVPPAACPDSLSIIRLGQGPMGQSMGDMD